MSHIELPRALEDYFAFAETERARDSRRFCITLCYFEGKRLDRIQWWYQVDATRERLIGEAGLAALRAQAAERFRRHIERWLENTGQRLHGDGPIPQLSALERPAPEMPAEPAAPVEPAALGSPAESNIVPWPKDRVANG